MSSAILDIQCVLGTDSHYLIKELSVIDTETYSTQHWIFKHDKSTQDAKSRRTNTWLEHFYHDLSLEYGDVEYEEIGRILNSLKFDQIYVKGEQKQKIISEFVPHIMVINIEDLGCPRLNQLCAEGNFPCCIFHINLNPKHCTFYKMFALRKWFINNT
jgi:hypothetical protein